MELDAARRLAGVRHKRRYLAKTRTSSRCLWTLLLPTDVIWVILTVEVGGLLGVTQQLSSFETEFNTQPQRDVRRDFNPFASPQKNKHDATDGGFREPGGAWERTQEPIQQDQTGLSHNAVNRASNGLQSNLSVVTYGQVCMRQVQGLAPRGSVPRWPFSHMVWATRRSSWTSPLVKTKRVYRIPVDQSAWDFTAGELLYFLSFVV